jgi:type II secretory ATPase GspE/PulE/Tfp pilus assembly ATPase PilB-like protein
MLHCRDAVGTVTALRNWGLPDPEIAEALVVVLGQRLVRKLCRRCARKVKPNGSELKWLEAMKLPAPRWLWTATGCKECQNIGYSGRTGVFELWRLDGNDYDLIMNHANEHALRERLDQISHPNLRHEAFAKVLDGTTSLAEIRGLSRLPLPSSTSRKSIPTFRKARQQL